MTDRRLAFALLMGVALLLRIPGMTAWGTFDNEVQKAWSAEAVDAGLATIYGPSDRELLETARQKGAATLLPTRIPWHWFDWESGRYAVDYPPGSLVLLHVAGLAYRARHPDLPNLPAFNAAINAFPLFAMIGIGLLLYASAPGRLGLVRAGAVLLNPAFVLAAPYLGYQDAIFGLPALGAAMALQSRRHVLAIALTVLSALIKPQGALLLPIVLVLMLREAPPRQWALAAAAGTAVATLVLMPWLIGGYVLSALGGCVRPLTQTVLSANGLSVWWIVGYVREWAIAGPWPVAQIVRFPEFLAWAGWSPGWLARVLVLGATARVMVLVWRWRSSDRSLVPAAIVLQVHAYALLGTSVHENHTFLAALVAPLLLGVWPEARAITSLTSLFLFLNIFLMAGLGRRITTQAWLQDLRMAGRLDLTVIVAAAHIALAVALWVWALRARARAGTV
jgi:hypothetical protein